MSDYIPSGYNNYGSTQQRPPLKSVYYPPQSQPSQQQLNPYPQGSQSQQQQYPQGSQGQEQQQNRPVPVFNKTETAPGVKDVTASFPPQFQQKQQVPQQSVYIGIPNDLYLVSSRPQDYQYPTQRQDSNANLMGTAGGYGNNYGTTQQQYQPIQQQFPQVVPQQFTQSAPQQLPPQVGQQQQYYQGAQQQQSRQQFNQFPQVAAQQQLPPGDVMVINAVGGQGAAEAVPFQQGNAASIPPQFQQQFGGQQPQQESVYLGMPNDNLYRTGRGSASGTQLRVARSEDNLRTAILNQDGNVVGIVEQQRQYPAYAAAQGQGQQAYGGGSGGTALHGVSSDYHLEGLRSGY